MREEKSSLLLLPALLSTLLLASILLLRGGKTIRIVESPSDFLVRKVGEYSRRRQRIRRFCHTRSRSVAGYDLRPYFFFLAPRNGLAYCHIPKVSSGTWASRFAELLPKSQINVTRPKLRKIFALPANREMALEQLQRPNLTSIVFTRHPLSRIVSFYKHKMVDQRTWNIWRPIVEAINAKKPLPLAVPNPEDTMRFILRPEQRRRRDIAAAHWQPQTTICPFCLMPFTIIGKMGPGMSEDAKFAAMAAKNVPITWTMDSRHEHKTNGSSEFDFWSRVRLKTIRRIVAMFSADFRMFGYGAPSTYFRQLGLVDVANKLDN